MRTNVAGVYACGDVTGEMLLAHVAYRQAEVCINNILGKMTLCVTTRCLPLSIPTPRLPESAKPKTAKDKGIDAEAVVLSMRYSGRYVAEVEQATAYAS